MKNLFTILLVTLICGNLSAQKVKIDKKTGIMSIDKVDVARFASSKNADKEDIYTFTGLDSDDYVSVRSIKLDESTPTFFEITSSLSDKVSEMEYELVNFTLSMNSAVSNLIVKKYNFFTVDGMNKTAIIDFLAQERNDNKLAYAEKQAEAQERQARIDQYSPVIKDMQVINKNTNQIIASFAKPSDGSRDIIVKDSQGNNFGRISYTVADQKKYYTLQMFDRKQFSLQEEANKDIRLVAIETLILNDYMGEDENSYIVAKQEIDKENANSEKSEAKREQQYKERAFVYGILKLVDGSVKEGEFKIEFRETAEGAVQNNEGNIVSLDGKLLYYYYINEKGKNKVKIYKEKEIQSFKIIKEDNPDFEEYYRKVEYIQNPEKTNNSLISTNGELDVMKISKNLLGGKSKPKQKSQLMYRAAHTDRITVYFSGKKIVIQDKKNGQDPILLNSVAYRDMLKEIVSDCPEILDNIENGVYRLSRKSIYQFAVDSQKCK